MNRYLDLYLRFFKISGLTFGGGYAMMPMVEKELVEKDELLKPTDVIDDYAMGQSIPGVIGVNASGLMGYRIAGRKGLISSILGFISPSIIIISLISLLLLNVQDNIIVQKMFLGLRAGVVALMLNSLLHISKKTLTSILAYILFIVGFISITIGGVHPFFVILFGAVISIINVYIFKGDKKWSIS